MVRDFCGHGIGRHFHEPPNVLHFGRPGEGPKLRPGMFFTVEPMVNAGRPEVKILDDGWTAVTRDRSLSAQYEHMIGVTETGAEIFTLSPAGLDKRTGPKEPEQREFRYGRSTGDLRQGYSVFGWHTQGVGGEAELAVDLVSQILGSGRSSRFFRHVIGPDAAATATTAHYQFDDVVPLTTPIRLKSGTRGYIAGRVWNIRRGVEEYDAMTEAHQVIHGLTANDFEVTGAPRQDLLRAA